MKMKVIVLMLVLVMFITSCEYKVVKQEVIEIQEDKVIDCKDLDSDEYGEGSDCKGIDCNDNDPMINPGVVDVPGDGIDNDCRNGDAFAPEKKDTDHDGILDEEEISLGLDPKNPDTDGDGLYDLEEIDIFGTNPRLADSDSDSWLDGCERTSKTDPLDMGSFPTADEDHDGLDDVWEIKSFSRPLQGNTAGLAYGPGEDKDRASMGRGQPGDGLTNLQEYCYDLDPMSSDTDKDNLADNVELTGYYTDPKNPDTDGDGFNDGREILVDGTNPLDSSSYYVYAETRNLQRSRGVRSDSVGSYRPTATYLGQSTNTGEQERDR